jgi:hypothetical protein
VYDLNKCYSQESSSNIIMKDISNYQTNNEPVYHTNYTCKLNATILHSKQKFDEKNKINDIIKNNQVKQGLSFKIVNGFYNGNSKFFLNSNTNYYDNATKFDNLQNATNNKINTVSSSYSIEWYGYFKPNITGNWTFTLLTDNISLLWIGDIAINDYENINASINTKGSNTISLKLISNKHYPIRIQYGNVELTQSNKFELKIVSPKNNDGIPLLCSLYNSDGTLFEKQLMYYSLNEISPDLTSKGLFNCYINYPKDTSNGIKQSSNDVSVCDGIYNNKYNKDIHYNKKNNKNMYLYRIDGDPKMNQLFMNNNIENEKSLLPVSNDNTILTNKYTKYNDKYPLRTDSDKVMQLSKNDCMKKCNESSTCNYFYSYSKNDNNYCILKNDSFPIQFIPKQPDNNIRKSDLYIRNKIPKLSDTDIRYKLKTINTNNYNSYSDYELLSDKPFIVSDKYNIGYNGLNDETQKLLIKNWKYINGSGVEKENFDNRGYKESKDVVNQSANPGDNNNIPNSIIQNQINPIIQISDDYSKLQKNVNDKYYDISNSILKIKNNNKTGIRDILSNDPNNIYDYSGNLFNYNNMKPKKENALKEDINTMILEQNNVLILGTITVATLLIGAIYFGK